MPLTRTLAHATRRFRRIAALGGAALALGGGALQPLTSFGAEPPLAYPVPPAAFPAQQPANTPPPPPLVAPGGDTLDLPLQTTPAAPPSVTAPAALPSSGGVGEVRAMWVVRDTMTSPARIRNAVALAKKYGFNTLFVQVRGRGDAFYDSRWEPRAEDLAGTPAGFDPLAVAVDEGHRAGLQVHAWLNTFFVWHKARRPWSARHVVNQHPEWLVADKRGRVRMTPFGDSEGAFLNPAVPEAREHTKNVFLDVATRYGVDGIHFDYVRFPCDDYSFGAYDLARFREWLSPRLSPAQIAYADAKRAKNRLAWHYLFRTEWRTWRQSLVTETVRSISDEAHRLRPEIIVSAAVFPNYGVASADKGQAWRDWLQSGILDAACPMSYNRSTALVVQQIRDAVQAANGRPIIAGVGAWQVSADSCIAKTRAFRGVGAAGVNFFSYNGVTREGRSEAYLAKVSRALFGERVAAPNWRKPVITAAGSTSTNAGGNAAGIVNNPNGDTTNGNSSNPVASDQPGRR